MIGVGDRIRVRLDCDDDDKKQCFQRYRGTVMCIDEEDDVVEIFKRESYENRGKRLIKIKSENDRFENVKIRNVERLQEFEYEEKFKEDPYDLKNQGNILFKLRDFEAAEEYYMKAVSVMVRPSKAGSIVFVRKGNSMIRCMVLDMEKNMLSVRTRYSIHTTKNRDDDEVLNVSSKQILCVCPDSAEQRELKCAIHCNLARVCMHRKNFNAALWHANIAHSISLESSPLNVNNVIKVLCLRARIQLECALPRHAKLDVARASALCEGKKQWYDDPDMKLDDLKRIASSCKEKKIRALAKSIIKNVKSRIKTKRTLAKEFSVWLSEISEKKHEDKE